MAWKPEKSPYAHAFALEKFLGCYSVVYVTRPTVICLVACGEVLTWGKNRKKPRQSPSPERLPFGQRARKLSNEALSSVSMFGVVNFA